MPAPEVGARAPDFTLISQDKTPVTLSEHFGKQTVVLAFFPLAFSPVCTAEMCTVRDSMTDFAASDASVFGISVDSLFSLKAFQHQLGLPFDLLSDFNKDVIGRYGVSYEDFFGLRGVAKRSVFVIDRQGVIRYRWVSEDADREPDYAGIRRLTRQLQQSPARQPPAL